MAIECAKNFHFLCKIPAIDEHIFTQGVFSPRSRKGVLNRVIHPYSDTKTMFFFLLWSTVCICLKCFEFNSLNSSLEGMPSNEISFSFKNHKAWTLNFQTVKTDQFWIGFQHSFKSVHFSYLTVFLLYSTSISRKSRIFTPYIFVGCMHHVLLVFIVRLRHKVLFTYWLFQK